MAEPRNKKASKKGTASQQSSSLKRIGAALARRSVLLFFLVLLGYGGYLGYTNFLLEHVNPTSDTPVTLRQDLLDEAMQLHEREAERNVPDDLSDPLDLPPGVSEDLVGGGARPF